jgi:hypothetical protein
MSRPQDRSGRTVRITVKLRPDEYDKFFCHVRLIGSNMSAFFRESAAKAMEKDRAGPALHSSIRHETDVHVDAVAGPNVSETSLNYQRPWASK